MKVLLIDDEPEICHILSYMLLRAGHEAHVFHSGEEALQQLPSLNPEVVVCDYKMPTMTGVEIFHAMRQTWGGHFILLTGEPQSERGKLAELGIKDVLFKPSGLTDLVPMLALLSGTM